MKRDVGSEFTTAGPTPPTLHWICSVTLRVLLKLSGTGAASVKLGQHHCNTASARTVVAGCFYHNLTNTDNRKACTEYGINLWLEKQSLEGRSETQRKDGDKLNGITIDCEEICKHSFR